MYQTGKTIKQTLEDIHRNSLVLPAIQREFVWDTKQICHLFDSIMQSFPFGTFLYWCVEEQNSDKFQFYGFVRDYHQRTNPHCPSLPLQTNRSLTAVLDGQQRLTALNIGLYGSMAVKQPRKWWSSPDAFPQKFLYVDLLWRPGDDGEDGTMYRFEFLEQPPGRLHSRGQCWFRVSDILSMESSGPAMVKWLNSKLGQEYVDDAYEVLYRLHEVVHKEHVIAYFEVRDQDLDKALQIFVRMNDGGTPLSFSDLLLSIAVAQWTDHDARQEIHQFVDELNELGRGLRFSKDFVLKAGLMLSDIGSLRFQVRNFNRPNMAKFESEWNAIKSSISLAVRLADSFGLNGHNLTSHNSLLPIAYYLHQIKADATFLTHGSRANDRALMRRWLMKSLLKAGVWGSAVDTLLTRLRSVIRSESDRGFPVSEIEQAMAVLGKSLVFVEEEIDDLVDVAYGDRRAFAVLSLAFPFVNVKYMFHLDHVYPKRVFDGESMARAGIEEGEYGEYFDKRDRLANLQLLEGPVNLEKGAKMPHEWLAEKFSKEGAIEHREQHLLGNVPESLVHFGEFYDARRGRLRKRIIDVLDRAGD